MQDAPPDLTRYVPTWLPYAVGVAYGVYRGAKKLLETHRAGKSAQKKERDGEIEEALSPLRVQLKEQRELADLRKEKIDELEREKREKADRIALLERKLSDGKELVDELQQTVFELRGEIAQLGRRLKLQEEGGDVHTTAS